MKIAFLGLNSNLTDTKKQEEVINYIKFNNYKIGEHASLISYFNNSLESIKGINIDNYNFVFCIGTDTAIYNHNIKENLSRILGKKLEINSSCETALKNYCNSHSLMYTSQEELMASIPSNSIPICDSNFYDNGFIYKYNNTFIVFLPSDIQFVKITYNSLILPLMKDFSTSNRECVIFKCYGILEKDIRSLISNELSNDKVNIQIISQRLDNSVYIRYNSEDANLVQNIIAEVCSKLSKFIYSTEDTSLYETAINLLKIQKKTIVLAETLTHGNLALNLSICDTQVIECSHIFNNFDAIVNNLKLEQKIIDQFGKYSVNTVYELDNLLLQSSSSNIAVFILGDRSCDMCYIAIGDIDGIHVYKNKIINFDDTLIDTLTETTLFYLIKKLRQNDLQFR